METNEIIELEKSLIEFNIRINELELTRLYVKGDYYYERLKFLQKLKSLVEKSINDLKNSNSI